MNAGLSFGGLRARGIRNALHPVVRHERFVFTYLPNAFDGFRVLGVLGRGGMGTVYRAEQKSLDREVALKVLSRELTSDPVFVARLQAEARAAARLHHPNVVKVSDVDHDGDAYFYSMELMHEGSVEQRLKQLGRMPV